MAERYTPAEEPWEWSCKDCHPNARIIDRDIHDAWHAKRAEAPAWGIQREVAGAQG